jgi:hypothetical protein
MIINLKNILEREDWSRLPLPETFDYKEILNPINNFPKDFENLLSKF